MSSLCTKYKGGVLDLRAPLKKGLDAHPITVERKNDPWMTVDLKAWNDFTTIFFQALGVSFETVVIDDALTSTIFLDYDADRGGYVQSPAYDALSKLWDEIRRFNRLANSETLSLIYETSPKAMGGRKTGSAQISTNKAGMLYGLAHRWINIVQLCHALIHHLDGKPFVMPELMPFSPIVGFEEKVLSERVSVEDLRKAMELDMPPED